MICVAISDKNPDKCIELLGKVEMAEIRLDLTEYTSDEIIKVFSSGTSCIATCRPDKVGLNKQYEALKTAMETGASYVDIEIEAPKEQREKLIKVAKANHARIIISYHNYNETPSIDELLKIVNECYEMGADVAKVAVQANSQQDAAKVLSLYSADKPVVALAMGEFGKITRLIAPMLGAEFTFASTDEGVGTAPGQITYSKMIEARSFYSKMMI